MQRIVKVLQSGKKSNILMKNHHQASNFQFF